MKIKPTNQKIRALAKTALFIGLFCPLFYAGPTEASAPPHTKVSLLSESETIQPGTSFWVGIELKMDDHWHTYWINPGDSGAKTRIDWKLPTGFKASHIYWPTPKRIFTPPIMTFGYENEAMLLVKITPPKSYQGPEKAKIGATIKWLECKDVCIPQKTDVSLLLPVQIEPPRIDANTYQVFSKARTKIPLTDEDWNVEGYESDDYWEIKITPPTWFGDDLGDISFFPEMEGMIFHAGQQEMSIQDDGSIWLRVQKEEDIEEDVTHLTGVLLSANGWRGKGSENGLSVNIPIKQTSSPLAPSVPPSLILVLLFALGGGLILNLMPCVLPVLSIKVLGLLNQGKMKISESIVHGLSYLLGILVTFWTLAILLLLLRASGEQLGWGFQLQSPVFVGILAVFFFFIGLNFFGFFEVGVSLIGLGQGHNKGGDKKGFISAFLSGILATVVATPCTAPFMGTALGYAITQPPIISLLVFTFLGIGMASPFVLLSSVPSLIRFLPKPGPWMITLKKFMGILMMLTVVWLLWVLNLQVSFIDFSRPTQGQQENKIQWEEFSEDRVSQLQQEGRTIFLDFTAAWCLTCQVNKRVTFGNSEVIATVKEKNMAMLRGDWTSHDPAITAALQRYGRNGVPVYVLYRPHNKGRYELLPEILTPNIFLKALDSPLPEK